MRKGDTEHQASNYLTSLKSKKNKPTKKQQLLTFLSYLLSIALFYWLFFVVLPSEIDYGQVKANLDSLSFADNLFLIAAGLGTILAIGWTAATVLPGLSVKKATQASVVGQLTAVILPPPADMVIRFGMYKTYGFSIDKSAIAVVLSGIARYFIVVVVALLGLFALLITGQGDMTTVIWLVGGVAVFSFAWWLMQQILSGKKAAKKVGLEIQKLVNWFLDFFRRKPIVNLDTSVVKFSIRSKDVVTKNIWPISLSNLVWGLSCYLVLFLAVRFCGIDSEIMSAAYLLLITGVMLILNCLPLPGSGVGVTEALLLSIINFPNEQVQSSFTAALFLYRIYTWLLPFPVGVVAYFVWRYQIGHGTVRQTKSLIT